MASKAHDYYAPIVLVAGAVFFLRSAYTLLNLPPNPSHVVTRQESNASPPPAPKLVSQSAVTNVTYSATIDDCHVTLQGLGERPKLRAGALLKLIDVAAGVAARRHANTSCVTISVDSVLCMLQRSHG